LVSIIIDDNVLLRSYVVEDAPELFNAVNSSRNHLHGWLNWIAKTTRQEHSLQFIQQSMQQQHNQEALALGIFYNYKLIGGIGMHQWEHQTRKAQIGYWVSKEFEGQGIIIRSLHKFIDFLFEKIGLNKIEIHFVAANKRSAKVAERLGFTIEGVLRQSVVRNGMPEDLVVTGLLKSEWKGRKN